MSRRPSPSEAAMQACLAQLEPHTERYQTLAAARRFKASWLELGQNLTLTREHGSFKAWGFPTFETYCRRELHIKAETANKLTRSFAFLREHEPSVLAGNAADPASTSVPPLDVVDLLSQARQRTSLSPAALAAVQEEVFAQTDAPTRQALLKKLRHQDPQAFKAKPKATAANVDDAATETPENSQIPSPVLSEMDMRKALALAERLASLLTAQAAAHPAQTVHYARSLVTALRQHFATVQRQQGAA